MLSLGSISSAASFYACPAACAANVLTGHSCGILPWFLLLSDCRFDNALSHLFTSDVLLGDIAVAWL